MRLAAPESAGAAIVINITPERVVGIELALVLAGLAFHAWASIAYPWFEPVFGIPQPFPPDFLRIAGLALAAFGAVWATRIAWEAGP